jgi:hypothetical protein
MQYEIKLKQAHQTVIWPDTCKMQQNVRKWNPIYSIKNSIFQ